jgi:hypothetical protein
VAVAGARPVKAAHSVSQWFVAPLHGLKSRHAGTTPGRPIDMLVLMPVTTPSRSLDSPRTPAMKGTIIDLRIQLKAPVVLSGPDLPCQQQDPNLWFSRVPAELNLAKAYCGGCRNRQSCLNGALERAEPAGVWGGEIFEDGQIIPFKRPRGRPRKTTCADATR